MLHIYFTRLVLGCILLVLMGCQLRIRPPQDETASPVVTPSPAPLLGGERIDIGGRSLFLSCMGSGRFTVVLEAGLGVGHSSWVFVQPGVANFARVCSYDRAGIGISDPAPSPRTSQDVAADLQALLATAAVPGPYILAGHSFGALHVRVYAHTYPDEVVGIVLIDPVHEDWWARAAALIPPPTADDSERLRTFRQFMQEDFKDPAKTGEGIDIPASIRQVQATSLPSTMPLILVKAGIQDILTKGLPIALETQLTQLLQEELPKELVELSSLSIKLDVPDSGHNIPMMQPDAVVVALRTMVDVAALSQ